jgi:hypothetical protein
LTSPISNQFNNRGGVATFHGVVGELLGQRGGLELDTRKVLAQAVVQILADAALLVAANAKQFFLQLSTLNSCRQHACERLQEVNVIVRESPSSRRMRSEHTVGLLSAMNDHAQATHNRTIEQD